MAKRRRAKAGAGAAAGLQKKPDDAASSGFYLPAGAFCGWDGETLVLNILGTPSANRDAIGKSPQSLPAVIGKALALPTMAAMPSKEMSARMRR